MEAAGDDYSDGLSQGASDGASLARARHESFIHGHLLSRHAHSLARSPFRSGSCGSQYLGQRIKGHIRYNI